MVKSAREENVVETLADDNQQFEESADSEHHELDEDVGAKIDDSVEESKSSAIRNPPLQLYLDLTNV
jgi:hypothetical protein